MKILSHYGDFALERVSLRPLMAKSSGIFSMAWVWLHICIFAGCIFDSLWNITKCNRKLLQNRSGLLQIAILQNATVITNCDDFITKCDSYFKMWRLLQIPTVQHNIVSIRSDSYYKMWRLLLIATVQHNIVSIRKNYIF